MRSFFVLSDRERKPTTQPTTQEKPTNNRSKEIKASEATNTIQATARAKQSTNIAGAKPTKIAAFSLFSP